MQVTVENTGTLGRRMTVAVPAKDLEQEVAQRIKRLAQTARLPGFRPGKAPLKMVEQQYAGKVIQEVAGDLIRTSFYEAVSERGLRPAGGPHFEPKRLSRGKDLEYTATFEVYPELRAANIKGKNIERPVVSISDEDLAATVETLRRQRTEWRATTRGAQNGDRLRVDFIGKIDGVAFAGGEASDFPFVLGNKVLLGGFEEGVLGAAPDDTRSVSVPFPSDYHEQSLAGKTAIFQITVRSVEEPVLPEVDAAFMVQFGVTDGSMEQFRKEVRANLEREAAERVRGIVREQTLQAIVAANDVDVPQALVDGEVERLIQGRRQALAARGMAAEMPVDASAYQQQARQRVQLALVLAEIIRAHGIKADAARVRARVEEMAQTYDTPQEFIDWHYAQPGRLAESEAYAVQEQVVELLLKDAVVADKAMSFKELMQPKPV